MISKKLIPILMGILLSGCAKNILEPSSANDLSYSGKNKQFMQISNKLSQLDKNLDYSKAVLRYGKIDWNKSILKITSNDTSSIDFAIPLRSDNEKVDAFIMAKIRSGRIEGNPKVYTSDIESNEVEKLSSSKNFSLLNHNPSNHNTKNIGGETTKKSFEKHNSARIASGTIPPGMCEVSFDIQYDINAGGDPIDFGSFFQSVCTQIEIAVNNMGGVGAAVASYQGIHVVVVAPIDIAPIVPTEMFFWNNGIGFNTGHGTVYDLTIRNVNVNCGGGGSPDIPNPDPCTEAILSGYSYGADDWDLPEEEYSTEINKRTIKSRKIIYRQEGLFESFYFISNDEAVHKKENGNWVFQSIKHSTVSEHGSFTGGILEYKDRFPPEEVIITPKQAKVELFYEVILHTTCQGVPNTRVLISNGEARKVFDIKD